MLFIIIIMIIIIHMKIITPTSNMNILSMK